MNWWAHLSWSHACLTVLVVAILITVLAWARSSRRAPRIGATPVRDPRSSIAAFNRMMDRT